MAANRTDLIQSIPDPDTIRREIAGAVREAEFLRRLLRLSEQAAKYECQEQKQQGQPP